MAKPIHHSYLEDRVAALEISLADLRDDVRSLVNLGLSRITTERTLADMKSRQARLKDLIADTDAKIKRKQAVLARSRPRRPKRKSKK